MVKMVLLCHVYFTSHVLIIEEANMENEELNVKDQTLKRKHQEVKYLAPSSRSKLMTIIISPK